MPQPRRSRRDREAVPTWLLTVIALVAFLLWVAGWVAEFVSRLHGGSFRAPDGALSLLMLILGGTLAVDRLLGRSKRAVEAATREFAVKEAEDDDHPRAK